MENIDILLLNQNTIKANSPNIKKRHFSFADRVTHKERDFNNDLKIFKCNDSKVEFKLFYLI